MARIGYARVSSYGQSLQVQQEKLNGCDRVFQEKQSGRTTDKREQLALCLDYVRDGDTLVRIAAAYGLGGVGPDAVSAVPLLTEMLTRGNSNEQQIAAQSLTKIGAPRRRP